MLVGIDGNSAQARRFKDLVLGLLGEVGGAPSEIDRLQVRTAATLQLHVEELAARIVRGEPVDPETMTRAANGATRALNALRRRVKPAAPQGPSLGDYLASRSKEAA
jgi:hypothetical protein